MGKVLGAVAAGVLTVATGGSFLGFTGLTAGLLSAASSLVLSGLTSALAPKQKQADPTSSYSAVIKGGSLTRQVRQPITARRQVYGEMRVSGPYAFIGSTNENEYLHFILMLASHEVDGIGEIWLNDESITDDMLNGSGDVTSGKYSGYARITKKLGTAVQGAESNMLAAFPDWTSDHRLQGIAYVYVRLKYNRDVFAGGIPVVTAWVRGKKVYDPRTAASAWSHNPALFVRDYLTDDLLGVGVLAADIDDTFVTSSANNCEEFVTTTSVTHTVTAVATGTEIFTLDGDTCKFQTGDRVTVSSTTSLPGGITDDTTDYFVILYQRRGTVRIKLAETYDDAIAGTAVDITSAGSGTITIIKNAEPRYSAGGIADSDGAPHEIITSMLSSMAGKAVYCGGTWRIMSGQYATPTISFNEDDLAGSLIVQTKTSRRERFNRVQGTYISPLNNGQPSDYPSVKNDTYKTEDGGKYIDYPLDLNFTQRPHTAQRLAKVALEIMRQEIVVSGRFMLTAFKCQVGDNILFSNDTYGWTDKPFEVVEWALQIEEREGVAIPYVEMKLKETAATIYDWSNGEETAVDPAPNTDLPNVTDVSAPTGLSFDSFPVVTLGGDTIFRIILSWDSHPDTFVLEGGEFEIQYKLASESDYKPSFFVDGEQTTSEIVQGSINVEYDLRIRAVNNVGVRSGWQPLTGIVAGSSGGIGSSEDWEDFSGSPGSSEDWEDFSGSPGSTEDWEFFI